MKKILNFLFAPKAAKTTAGALAGKFGLELRGDKNAKIVGIAPIADAIAGQLAFYSDEKNSAAFKILPIEVLKNTKASVILVQPEHADEAPAGATLLIAASPRGEIVKILGEIYKEKLKFGIDIMARVARGVYFRKRRSVYIAPYAVVDRGAVIERNVRIGPGAYIGAGVTLGENTIVGSGVVILNASIGSDCIIQNNAVIGKDGFGFTVQDGKNVFIPHVGRVVVHDRVSIGSCSCIDRGLMTDTIIGEGTKIDNLCQIAHGVVIGKECFLASGTGIAGGTVVGDRVLIGGHAGISNKLTIGSDAEIGACSAVFRSVKPGEKTLGNPAVGAIECMRNLAWTRGQVKK
jgi:UDP-3-O-[3-hydroxymyristoyl] glucosamine N-acyltransferase